FSVVDGGTVGAVNGTLGMTLAAVPLGDGGLLVAHDGTNGSENANLKLVAWANIANAALQLDGGALGIDTSLDPRPPVSLIDGGTDGGIDGGALTDGGGGSGSGATPPGGSSSPPPASTK